MFECVMMLSRDHTASFLLIVLQLKWKAITSVSYQLSTLDKSEVGQDRECPWSGSVKTCIELFCYKFILIHVLGVPFSPTWSSNLIPKIYRVKYSNSWWNILTLTHKILYFRKTFNFAQSAYRKKLSESYLLYEDMSISSGNSEMLTSNLSCTSFNTLASVSSDTNVIANPFVPNLPALATC